MIIGYARVSTQDQNPEFQVDALEKAGCEQIFQEKFTGKLRERPELSQCLRTLRKGDIQIVWKLDRLARSLKDLVEIVQELDDREIGLKSLTKSIDTSSSGGRLVFHIFGALAEFEHDLIRERTIAGLQAARAEGEKVAENRPCVSQADSVVDYLARYSHRIAISNGRLLSMEGDQVSFRYKDYRDGSRIKTQWLEGQEFVRRFLMHILPKGFMRIRHFGYLSNRTRRRKLAVIRHCLAQPPKSAATLESPVSQRCWPCLLCDNGLVRMIRQIPRFRPAVILTG